MIKIVFSLLFPNITTQGLKFYKKMYSPLKKMTSIPTFSLSCNIVLLTLIHLLPFCITNLHWVLCYWAICQFRVMLEVCTILPAFFF